MKCEARLRPTENIGKWQCAVSRNGVDSLVLSAINAVSGFIEGAVVYLAN